MIDIIAFYTYFTNTNYRLSFPPNSGREISGNLGLKWCGQEAKRAPIWMHWSACARRKGLVLAVTLWWWRVWGPQLMDYCWDWCCFGLVMCGSPDTEQNIAYEWMLERYEKSKVTRRPSILKKSRKRKRIRREREKGQTMCKMAHSAPLEAGPNISSTQ